jgi:hypothetical protein
MLALLLVHIALTRAHSDQTIALAELAGVDVLEPESMGGCADELVAPLSHQLLLGATVGGEVIETNGAVLVTEEGLRVAGEVAMSAGVAPA